MSLKLEFATMSKAGPRSDGFGPLAPRPDDWIGRQLRRIYRDVMEEPLPEDLTELLERLDAPRDNDLPTSR
jgi:hypothetical protein